MPFAASALAFCRRAWQAVRQAIAKRIRQRVTAAGLLFALMIALVGITAFASANNLLFLLLAAMIATLLVSGLISRLGLSGLALELDVPDRLWAQQPVSGRLWLRNTKRVIPSFSIHVVGSATSGMQQPVYVPFLPGGGSADTKAQFLFTRRGWQRGREFTLSSRFPFGFAERRVRVAFKGDLLIYPAPLATPAAQQALSDIQGQWQRQAGAGTEFHRIRPHVWQDTWRHVDWRATARTGSLHTREFTTPAAGQVTLVLDRDAPEGDEFERGISSLAFLITQLQATHWAVRLRTQEGDVSFRADSKSDTMLKELALVQARPGAAPFSPDDKQDYAVLCSPHPARWLQAGWRIGALLGPAEWPGAVPERARR